MNGQMKNVIENQQFDEERALYNLQNTLVSNCNFAGPADGESALKEARNVKVKDTNFSLRYPLWHVQGFELDNVTMDELTRAALWYVIDGKIVGSKLGGIKALRSCDNIEIKDSDIDSAEFGWKCNDISVVNSNLKSEYVFLDSNNITLENVQMQGKYSFQYIDGLTIKDSVLDTKDAFWHSKNVTVENSVVKGEYLAWFSENLTLINCKIIGTQPLCYCKNLKLIDCTMEGTDLAFEYSEVDATVIGHVDSIKNPKSGKIVVDSVDDVIMEDAIMECVGQVQVRN